jgi:CheY-like chemotaxis protein
MFFKMRGYEVRAAFDAARAIAEAQAFCPHLTVLDIGMPEKDGYEVARHLQELDCPEEGVLVAVTGFAYPADRFRCAEAGFDLHLAKPVDFEVLEHALLLRQRAELAITQARAMAQLIRETINMGSTLLDVAATTKDKSQRQRCLSKVDKHCQRLSALLDAEVPEREHLVAELEKLHMRWVALVEADASIGSVGRATGPLGLRGDSG